MLGIGEKFPEFCLTTTISTDPKNAFSEMDHSVLNKKWSVFFFWPKDFTFVCPTEIIEFDRLKKDFESRNAQLIGASIDSEFVHLAWRQNHPDLKNISFPMISDIKRELSEKLGILDKKAGVSQRAVYVIDPDGMIRFVMVTDLSVGRNPKEVLRVLDALQTGELCPVSWQKGDAVLKP
jgi:alkyl hydroperoxide reductase subunit AhpC